MSDQADKSEAADKNEQVEKNEPAESILKVTVSCIGESVPCEERESTECPSLMIAEDELNDIQEKVSDREIEISTLAEFKIRQSIHDFKANTHYWFVIRYNEDDPEIRYLAPYADDVVEFFEDHYYIDQIGHSSLLPLDEFVASYNVDSDAAVVKFAGTFNTDSDGKIQYWSNDSGHFLSSQDYAAPVARALGIEDAVFITWVGEDMDQTIYYQQYRTYTGAYHANSVGAKIMDDGEQDIFYPHDYHTWYKYHGEKVKSMHHQHHHHHHHAHGHTFGFLQSPLFLIGIFIALVCCMIGFIVSFFVKRSKTVKHVMLEQDDL